MTDQNAQRKAPDVIRVTLARSHTGCKPSQRATLRALGLHRVRQSVVHEDTDAVRGMINQVSHLVELEPAE
ncbi:MAG: 50S ribosomal protein L30 [candidate division WS1 bacterium]|jgi:large subunit ribosomal protein L30|nr:50S ribosomal protein L30 [candidate division WS1 bacterium]